MSIANAAHHSMIGVGRKIQEIGSVYSDGVAYTVMPHVHTNAKVGRVEFYFHALESLGSTDINAKNLFGCSTRDANWLMNNYNQQWAGIYWEFQLYAGSGHLQERLIISSVRNTSHHVVCDRTANQAALVFDGTTTTMSTITNMTLGRLGLFTQNDAGAGAGISPVPNRVPKNIAIGRFKYWDGDMLAGDLIPVRISPSEVGFYDAISGLYLTNLANSGAFLEGPEIVM